VKLRLCAAVIAAVLCAVCGAQQTALPPGVYHAGGDVTPPVLLGKQAPEYSKEARMARLQGTVVLYVVIGEDGRARDMRVGRPLGMGLDEKAMTAVSQWRFAPARRQECRSRSPPRSRLISGSRWIRASGASHGWRS